VIIRQAAADDLEAIYAVHVAAFARRGVDVPVEAPLFKRLHVDGDLIRPLCLVAEIDGQIVGHVACSYGRVADRPLVGLGPIGVLPPRQGGGVGHALMHAVVAAADALDEPAVVLLGDPAFYRRFGFEPAVRYDVRPPEHAWAAHFQIRRLHAWSDTIRGTFRYAAAFEQL
jgi:putative acetyltransferase